jgi:hypothetical protein
MQAESLKKQRNKRLFHAVFVSSPTEVESITATCNYAYLYVSMIDYDECPDVIDITAVDII